MVRIALVLDPSAANLRQMVDARRSLVVALRLDPDCLGCSVCPAEGEDPVVHYEENWPDEGAAAGVLGSLHMAPSTDGNRGPRALHSTSSRIGAASTTWRPSGANARSRRTWKTTVNPTLKDVISC